MNKDGKLTPRQEKTISALLEQPTIEKAAESVGVNSRTIRKWMKHPEFKAAFLDAGRKVVEQAHSLLRQASCEAVEALRRNLKCETPGVEVPAALGILDQWWWCGLGENRGSGWGRDRGSGWGRGRGRGTSYIE